jgi:DNA integrity scanning protein DisA with diadenylate cyclase activity
LSRFSISEIRREVLARGLVTASLAVVVSQSTGAVTLFKGGGLLMSLEKPRSLGT